jgi:TonB family protein
MLSSDASFKTNPAERLIQPRKISELKRPAAYFAVLVALLIHAGVLSPLFFEDTPAHLQKTEEIPVEIVAEPPPEKKPEPPPGKKPEALQERPSPPAPPPSLDETAAFDAPRAQTKEKVDKAAPDKTADAARAPDHQDHKEQPSPVEPPPDPAPKDESAPKAADKQAEPVPDKPDAEVIRQAQIDPKAPTQEAQVDAKAPAPPLPTFADQPSPWAKKQSFTAPEALADVEAVSSPEPTPVSGGKAKTTYLTIVYGLVMSHMHMPEEVIANAVRVEGVIVFSVDGAGNVTRRKIAHSSGSRELDTAALAAVDQSSPFPAPPGGSPIGMTFTYGAR